MSGNDDVNDNRKTERIVVWADSALELELLRLANADKRPLSEYCRVVLIRHVWGHAAATADDKQGANSAESRRAV